MNNKKLDPQVKRMFQNEANKKAKKKQLVQKTLVVGATTIMLAGAGSFIEAHADTVYDLSNYRGVGYMMSVDEVGINGNGGTIGLVKSDTGGVSYGICQMATNAGTPDDFVKWLKTSGEFSDYYKFFEDAGNPKAGTESFSNAWTKAYESNNRGFEKAQMGYIEKVLVPSSYNKVKNNYGIDMLKSRTRTEILYATAIQFGPQGICELFDHTDITDDMDDQTFVEKFETAKYKSVGNYKFMYCNDKVRAAARDRFTREKVELLKLAKEEAGPLLDEMPNEVETTTEKEGVSQEEVIEDTAANYKDKGITYSFGEKNVKTGSLDCSGLVSQMMNDIGVDVDAGNTNALKFCNDSKKISKEDVEPGDLVFWVDDKHDGSRHNSVFHIGMYIGNDTIVDCSPAHSGVGTRKLSECKDVPGDFHYSYGRYEELEDKLQDYASKISESINEFDDVITVDNKYIQEDYEKVEEDLTEIKDTIQDNNQNEDNNELTTDENQDGEFDSVINDKPSEDAKDKNSGNQESEESEEDKSDSDKQDKENSNQESQSNEENENNKNEENNNDGSLDNTLVVGDSNSKGLEKVIEDNYDNTQVEATVGASAYVYLNDTKTFGEALLNTLPENSDDIEQIVLTLGINNIEGATNKDDVIKVIEKLQEKYPGKPIQVIKVNPVGDQYDGDTEKINGLVDELNKSLEDYSKDNDNVNIIDATDGLVEDGKLTETNDGLHVKDNEKFLENIENGIKDADNKQQDLEEINNDSDNYDEFDSVIEEDNEDTEKEETSVEENNGQQDLEEINNDSDNYDEFDSVIEEDNKDTEKEENPVEEETPTVEENDDSNVEDNKDTEKEETPTVEETPVEEDNKDTEKEENPVEEETPTVEENDDSNVEETPTVEENDDSNVEDNKDTEKEENPVEEETPTVEENDDSNVEETPTVEETPVEENKDTEKEETPTVEETPVEETQPTQEVQEPVVEDNKDIQKEETPAVEETQPTQDNNNVQEEGNTKTDELHSRLQNNLFGRIFLG